jgi:hypothetical protein
VRRFPVAVALTLVGRLGVYVFARVVGDLGDPPIA